MKTKRKGKMAYVLLTINIIPLAFLGITILMLGSSMFTRAMYQEVEIELRNVCRNLDTTYDTLCPGDYSLTGDSSYRLYKGDHDITGDYTLIDQFKQNTGLDITLFYQDTRILTTIVDNNGVRITGSGAPAAVMKDVFETGTAKFYTNVLIFDTSYFSYYAPLTNSNGTVVGMLFVGKPTAEVDASVKASIYPLVIADILIMLLASLFIFLYTRSFTSALLQIHDFLGEVSTGNLSAEPPALALKRNDELNEIAGSALNMQRSLHDLVEQDSLTALANRRFGDKRLRQTMKNAVKYGNDFCLAIGDIDDFKKVNDTYGHDCGDLVLKQIADILRRHMRGNGFVARWGGEEFLLVFENMDLAQARELLEKLLDDVRSAVCRYDDQSVSVTMTFGLAAGGGQNVTDLLRTADDRLYQGKKGGKNQII